MEFKAFEAAGWAERAATYDDLIGAVTARLIEPLLDAAGVGARTRLLDAACGPGTLAAAAAARGAEPVGVDLAPGMVALARERHPALRFLEGDAEALPFEDASFDAVAAGFLVHHLPDPAAAAAEFARVLAPGGRIAATVWDRPERMRLLGLANEAMERAGADTSGLPEGPDAFGIADPEEFAALLRDAGFQAAEVRAVAFTHRAASAEELFEGLLGGTVRTTEQMRAQPPEVARRVREAFAELSEAHRGADGALHVPVAAVLASARRG
jgi:ubiquinone/menaquinone biosynthesis C-methylase UbiE